ncbi:MAG: PLP-dependent aminotransferase family protein [Litoreibacter sp.]
MRDKSNWEPRIASGDGPIYQRIAAAIIEDIEAGKIPQGTRLPAQRDLAFTLDVGLGTVTKAYNLITRRGVGKAEKGRAMFVTSLPAQTSKVELHANIPPNLLSREMLSRTLLELSQVVSTVPPQTAEPYQGSYDHRKSLAAWLRTYCPTIGPENMIMCNGGQHAIWMALSVLKQEDSVVVTDELPFPGLIWVVEKLGMEVSNIRSDRHGMDINDLENKIISLLSKGKNPILYIATTAQNPTGVSLSNSKIRAIARICKRLNVSIIEDDVYAAFSSENHVSFYELLPKLVFYINSLAKILSPWFRLGVLVVPSHFHTKALDMVSVQGSKVSPIMTQVLQHWIISGLAEEVATMTHQEGIKRNKLAATLFDSPKDAWIGNGFHMFLPMSLTDSQKLWQSANEVGILLTRPSESFLDGSNRSGIRICMGPPSIEDLKTSLEKIVNLHREILKEPA